MGFKYNSNGQLMGMHPRHIESSSERQLFREQWQRWASEMHKLADIGNMPVNVREQLSDDLQRAIDNAISVRYS